MAQRAVYIPFTARASTSTLVLQYPAVSEEYIGCIDIVSHHQRYYMDGVVYDITIKLINGRVLCRYYLVITIVYKIGDGYYNTEINCFRFINDV
jgi:hypothetical protein